MFLLIILIYFVVDYQGPAEIPLKPFIEFRTSCLRAKDLVVQEYDAMGNLWATRGMLIYRLIKGETRFIRVAHVPTGFSVFWLNNFTLFRRITLKPECIEMVITDSGEICAISVGYIWYCATGSKKFCKSLKLTNYGIGVGRGTLSTGFLNTKDSLIFFGEYFRNEERTYVRIYASNNSGMNWKIVHEFQPGEIRHIHALQKDPFTGKLWVCTGDEDNESMIGWSEDNYMTIVPIGKGSQLWRSCQLAFSEKAVYWGTDTGSEELAGIYRWDKESQELVKLHKCDGAIFYSTRLAKGTIVLSSDREGFPNEKDDMTRLYIIDKDDKITIINCGTWKFKKTTFRSSFAKLRLQRNQGYDKLAISCLNQKEIPESELLIISEDVFYN